MPLDIRPAVDDAEIIDQVRASQLGAVRVTALTIIPGEAARTPALIRRSDPDLCKIDVLDRGSLVVEQDGREAVLGAGDLAFVDFSRPCHWASSRRGASP